MALEEEAYMPDLWAQYLIEHLPTEADLQRRSL